MIELVHERLQFLLEDHEVHDHPVLSDVPFQPQTEDVGVSVQSGTFLVSGYEVASGEPNPRVSSINLEYHTIFSVSFMARAIEST